MLTSFALVVLLRAAAAAAVVVTASVLAEAAGPFWGGLIVALPISAGPAYVMLAMQHDAAFIATGALGSLFGNALNVLYMLAIIWLSPRLRWPLVVPCALTAWFAAAVLLRQVSWGLGGVLALNVAVFAIGFWLTRRSLALSGTRAKGGARRWFDLPLRGIMVGSLTATVVTASRWLGPTVTGIAATFPIALTGLALLVLPRIGGEATAALFAATLRAMPGFALAALVLHLTAAPLGAWRGMLCALLAQLAFSAVLMLRNAAGRPRRGRRVRSAA